RVFFFSSRRRHTRSKRDWSSDVCSSDLVAHHQKVQDKGGVLKTKLDAIKGAHYSVPVESLQSLADDPDVAYISPNRPLSGTSTRSEERRVGKECRSRRLTYN